MTKFTTQLPPDHAAHTRGADVLDRLLTHYADKTRREVSNPCITAFDAICLADELVKRLAPPAERPVAVGKPRKELLSLAESCGAKLTGKPDGSEAITIVFTIAAWREFDAALVSAK